MRRCGPPIPRLRDDASPPSTGGSAVSPRVLREIDIATTTQTLVSRCLRDRRPDCQRRQGGRRQVPPGVAPGPRPFPAPTWPLARGRGSPSGCPAPHPAGAETATDKRPESPPAPVGPGTGDVRCRTTTVAGEARGGVEMLGLRGRKTSVGSRRRPSRREGRCRRRSRPGGVT